MEADDGVRINLDPDANAAEVTEHPHGLVPGEVEPDEAGQAGAEGHAAEGGRSERWEREGDPNFPPGPQPGEPQ